MFFVACMTEKGGPGPGLITLPNQSEWTVDLNTPLEVVPWNSFFVDMPKVVREAFPFPDVPTGEVRQPLVQPRDYAYGMDSDQCVVDTLFKANDLPRNFSWGWEGGQYAFYRRFKSENPSLYDPQQYAFLFVYAGIPLEVTFPDLQTMHVRRLAAPDLAEIEFCNRDTD